MENKVLNKPEKISKPVYNPMLGYDKIFGAIIFMLCFILVDFILFGGISLGFTLGYFLLMAVTVAYLVQKGKRPSAFSIIIGLLSLAGSVTLTLFCDTLINGFMFILVCGLYVVFAVDFSGSFKHSKGSFKMLIDVVHSVFVGPFKNIPTIVGSIAAGDKKNKKFVGSLIGFLVSIPFLAAIIYLLVSSDAAFEGFVTSIFSSIGSKFAELIVALIVFPYAFSFLFRLRNKTSQLDTTITNTNKHRIIPYSACVSFLSAISVTYVLYIFSQLAYLFSAFSNILPEGYNNTASQYARRGFYEMFAVCVINIFIISVINMFIKTKKSNLAIKILSLFVSLFSVLLIIIAIQKMRLNIGTYGLSRNRILVVAFMIMMLVVFAFFIIHLFAPKVKYMQSIIIACSVIFIALSYSNINYYVAQYNVNAYESGELKELDTNALMKLSAPAYPFVISQVESGKIPYDEFIGEYVGMYFYDEINGIYDYYEETLPDGKGKVIKREKWLPAKTKFTNYNVTKSNVVNKLIEYNNSNPQTRE